MANQITGRILEIGQTVEIPSKKGGNPYLKREFLLDATPYDPYTGERSQYENIVPLELSGDKCAELDNFKTGDVVTVTFNLQGRAWTDQDGELKRMVSIRCYKLEARKHSTIQPAGQPAGQPAYQAPQQPAYQQPQQPTYQQPVYQQPQYASAPPATNTGQAFPPPVDANGNVKNDLPF